MYSNKIGFLGRCVLQDCEWRLSTKHKDARRIHTHKRTYTAALFSYRQRNRLAMFRSTCVYSRKPMSKMPSVGLNLVLRDTKVSFLQYNYIRLYKEKSAC